MKPVILLTAGFGTERDMSQRRLFETYADAVYEAGGLPVLALCSDERLVSSADGLFLTGGEDIVPETYGQETTPACGETCKRRDEEEQRLFRVFYEAEKPVLGVCRGMQMINTALGGTLFQDIETECGVNGHRGTIHNVKIEENSVLGHLFSDEIIVNSYHHQSINILADGFLVTARNGSIIEGVEHETLPIWAVQWHPERMFGRKRITASGPDMMPLFRKFVEECKKTRKVKGRTSC